MENNIAKYDKLKNNEDINIKISDCPLCGSKELKYWSSYNNIKVKCKKCEYTAQLNNNELHIYLG